MALWTDVAGGMSGSSAEEPETCDGCDHQHGDAATISHVYVSGAGAEVGASLTAAERDCGA